MRRRQASASNRARASSSSTAPCSLSCPAFTAFDAAIEEEGQPVSAQQRCATLHVSPGKLVSGYFYIKTRKVVTDPSLPAVEASKN
jgi:hypothetical protein